MEDIHIRQVKLETILIDKRDDIDSLIKSKVEMSEQINTIDKNLMRKIIEKSSSTMDKDAEKKDGRKYNAGATCDFCKSTFPRYCDLEDHIEATHRNQHRFNCSECDKTFVTEWRLRKHSNMHKAKSVKSFKYYVAGVFCPFEKYGCKFRHVKDKSRTDSFNDSVDKSMNISCDVNNFQTSTPSKRRKILQCSGICSTKDQCANCIVREMLQYGEINLKDSVLY